MTATHGAGEAKGETTETMPAVVHDRFGGPEVLRLERIPRPEPAEGRIVLQVKAASVNPLDWHFIRGLPYLVRLQGGLRTPKRRVPGADVAGVVVAVGAGVTDLSVGDEVYGEVPGGGFADYVTARGDLMAPKPAEVTFEQAAAVPVAGFTALQALRDHAGVTPGDRVLVNGASGGVGTFAVQIAAALGATVTGVCSTPNVELVRSLGATDVIDYTAEDVARGTRRFDVVLDVVGNLSPFGVRRILEPTGTAVLIGADGMGDWIGPLTHLARARVASITGKPTVRTMLAKANRGDLEYLNGLMASGALTPVVERSYPLDEAADAVAHVETGRARGKVIVTV